MKYVEESAQWFHNHAQDNSDKYVVFRTLRNKCTVVGEYLTLGTYNTTGNFSSKTLYHLIIHLLYTVDVENPKFVYIDDEIHLKYFNFAIFCIR